MDLFRADLSGANLLGAVIDPEDLKWAKMFWVRLDETGDGGVLSS